MKKCSRCDALLVEDSSHIWRNMDGRASCKRGGPHRPVVEEVPVVWDEWESVLDSWSRDAL